MVIFDLDGTLADCEHRRHFVEPNLNIEHDGSVTSVRGWKYGWKPDWDSFYQACDKDTPIWPVISIWDDQIGLGCVNQIWSGRCESVREKTEQWLKRNLLVFEPKQLKMRPIGDCTPDHLLKERWLNERCADLIEAASEGENPKKHDIQYVFDDRPKVIRMWRRRGIFVFNCSQTDREF